METTPDLYAYFLTGRGGSLQGGLGTAISSFTNRLYGREISGEFEKLALLEQVQIVQRDLNSLYSENLRVIADSYGAYILLHSLINRDIQLPGVLLLSPVSGPATGDGRYFRPPGTKALKDAINNQRLGTEHTGRIVTGEEDWQSPPSDCRRLGAAMGIECLVLDDVGHRVPASYVHQELFSLFKVK